MSEAKGQYQITEQQRKDFWDAIVISSRRTRVKYDKDIQARIERSRKMQEFLKNLNKS